jgi:hypothetical protein
VNVRRRIPRWPSSLRRALLLAGAGLLAILAAVAGGLLGSRPAQAAVSCGAPAGPVGGSYAITVCLVTAFDPGASVSGETAVSARVTVGGDQPGIQRVIFYLDDAYLLTDYLPDAGLYGFTLDTARFADGPHKLGVEVRARDGYVTPRTPLVETTAAFANGNAAPPVNTRQFTPVVPVPAAGAPLVVAATGDGASGEPKGSEVVNLIAGWSPNLFLYLGDVYEKGTPTEFDNYYGGPADLGLFGRFRAITNPTIGNHEYEDGVAPGYFDHWDNVPHYYSYDAGGWHFISLDSNDQFGQLDPGSLQYDWLLEDLARNAGTRCTLAYLHHPLYSVGPEAYPKVANLWRLLASSGVDILVTGHDHTYQRWTPLDAAGNPSYNGMTQFVVGTGGHALQSIVASDPRALVAVRAFGALRLELGADGATYRFDDVAGAAVDTGYQACVPLLNPPPPPPPPAPTEPAPTTPTTTVPVTPPAPPRLAAALTVRRLTARPRARVVVRYAASLPGRATLALFRGRRRVLAVSRASRKGKNAIALRGPARTGRYQVVLTLRVGKRAVVARGQLTVRPPVRR